MIVQILIISLFCCGVFVTGEPGMIFEGLKERLRRWATYNDYEIRVRAIHGGATEYINHPTTQERWWFKPVWGCVLCMASVWGTIGFVLLNFWWFSIIGWEDILTRWVVTIFCVCIMNGIIWNVYGLLGNLLQYWEEKTK